MSVEAGPSGLKTIDEPVASTSRSSTELDFTDTLDDEKQGYLKVDLGELLVDRYRVIKNLGRGQFATVWLCWDFVNRQFVAIKIVKGQRSYQTSAENEIWTLGEVHNADYSDVNRQKIIEIINNFDIKSKNGLHKCLVYDIIGIDLYQMIITYYRTGFSLWKVKCIIRQVLQALCYLHTKCGIIHADIKPENVLICLTKSYVCKEADEATEKYLIDKEQLSPMSSGSEDTTSDQEIATHSNVEETTGKNVRKNYSKKQRGSSKKSKYSQEVELSKKLKYYPWKDTAQPSEDESLLVWGNDLEVRLTDFGNACSVEFHCEPIIQTRHYRSLEVIIGAEYYTSADIWSTACMAYELATGDFLFNASPFEGFSNDETLIKEIVSILGKVPKRIRSLGKLSHKFFDQNGNLKNDTIFKERTIKHKLIKDYEWAPKDAVEFANFLEMMLSYDPIARASAADCLQHPWLQNY